MPLCTAAAPPTDKPPYFITTPIYYVNGQPHIGHAYTTLACDVIARFKRLDGHDVLFLTGTDEHGQKVQQSAEAAGETPQAFADRVSDTFRALLPVYNFSCDQFIRTTESRHTAAAQALWRKLLDSGDIYLGEYEGWYSVRDEAFYTEGELVDGLAPTGAPVEWVKESSYAARRAQFVGAQFGAQFRNSARNYPTPHTPLPGTSSSSPSGASRSSAHPRERRLHRSDLAAERGALVHARRAARPLDLADDVHVGRPVPDQPDGGEHIMYVWLDAR